MMPLEIPTVSVVVTALPNITIDSMPSVVISSLPNVTIGAMPSVDIASMPLVSVEEQYELLERKALAVTVGGENHSIATSAPKVACVIVDGCDMQVDTQAITADSPKFLIGSSWSYTLKGVTTTIYAKAVAGTGTLYIMVFK